MGIIWIKMCDIYIIIYLYNKRKRVMDDAYTRGGTVPATTGSSLSNMGCEE